MEPIGDWLELRSLEETMESHFPRKKKQPIFFLMKHDFYITISSATAFRLFLARFRDRKRVSHRLRIEISASLTAAQ